jgi:hypothetical protein
MNPIIDREGQLHMTTQQRVVRSWCSFCDANMKMKQQQNTIPFASVHIPTVTMSVLHTNKNSNTNSVRLSRVTKQNYLVKLDFSSFFHT